MIIKARAGKGGQALARYLEGGKNEHAAVLGYRNLNAPSLKAAIYDMDMMAKESKAEKHAYHVQMRAAHGEHLNPEQWQEATDRYAKALGMQDHQAAIVLHNNPDGSTHCHIVFNRVHPETLKAADLWQDREKCKDIARELERDFGLQQVSNEKTKTRDHSRAGEKETEQARQSGENVHDIRDRIKEAWEQSQDGQGFQAVLEQQGFTLAKGDRRDFVAVDEHGKPYSIGKRTTGATAEQVRDKLADLTPENMPTIDQAKQHQQERHNQQRDHQAESIKTAWNENQPADPANTFSMEGATAIESAWWRAARAKLDYTQQPEPPENAWLKAQRARQEMRPEPAQDFNQQAAEKAKEPEGIKQGFNDQVERDLTREEKIAARLARYEAEKKERENTKTHGRVRSRNFAQEQREREKQAQMERIAARRKMAQDLENDNSRGNEYEP